MRRFCVVGGAMVGLVAGCLVSASARADDIPIQILQNWRAYNNAGWMLLNRGDYNKAEHRFRMAIEEIRPYATTDRRLLARSYADLARVLYHQGRYADAEPLAEWALTVREWTPKVNPDALFQSLYTLALIHVAQDHFNKAEPLLRRALEVQEREVGPDHNHTAATLDELAGVCAEQRKFRDADVFYRRAIAIYQQTNPDVNLELADCAGRYAAMLDRMDRKDEAAKLRNWAREIRAAVEDAKASRKAAGARPEFKGFK